MVGTISLCCTHCLGVYIHPLQRQRVCNYVSRMRMRFLAKEKKKKGSVSRRMTNVFSSRPLLDPLSPGTLLEIQNLNPCPDLLNQNWPFKSLPRESGHTLYFEKHCPRLLDSVFLSTGQRWGRTFVGSARPSLLKSGPGNDVGEGKRQPRGLMYPYVRKNSEAQVIGDSWKKETLI